MEDYIGIVEDNDDPQYKGRVKIRVFGKFDQKIDDDESKDFVIPTESLPWARPEIKESGNIGGGSTFSIPKLGSILNVYFLDGNEYSPIYTSYKSVSDDVMEEIKKSYKNSHVLLYDTCFGDKKNGEEYSNSRDGEHIKIYFTEENGLVIDYKTKNYESAINIDNSNNIKIESKKDKYSIKITPSGKVYIDANKVYLGKSAEHALIQGDTFLKLFNTHIHPGNGTPPAFQITNDMVLSKTSFTK